MSSRRKKSAMRRLVQIILLLLLAGILGAGWYVYDRGFTRKWRTYVSDEFRKHGVEMSLRQLALEPFRGIVARDVKVYDGNDRKRTLAVIDEMLLVINYANLFRGEPFLEALDLRDARLAIPLDRKNPRGPAAEISKLSGRLLLPPQQIYLSRLDAELYGIHVSASGRLVNPQAFKPKTDTTGSDKVALIGRIIDEFKGMRYEAEPPQLALRFSGDLAQPGDVFVEASLVGRKIRRGEYRVANLQLDADFRQGVMTLKRLVVKDGKGSLAASGGFESVTREASLHLRSTLDAPALARSLGYGAQLIDLSVRGGSSLELNASAKLGDNFSSKLVGHVELPRFSWRSVEFESGSADFSWSDGKWSARDVMLTHRTGQATGDAMFVPGDFRARLRSTMNPRVLAPLFTGKAAEVFAQFDFADAPAMDAEIRGPDLSPENWTAEAKVKLGRASFRDVPAEALAATIRYENRKLSIAPFTLQRTEGGANGGVIVDFVKQEVLLDKIRSSVTPAEVITWFAPNILKDVAPYRFVRRPPNVFVDGIVHTKGGNSTRLTLDVDAPQGMDYTFLKKNLSSSQISGKLLFTSDRLKISGLSAAIYGGRLSGDADISIVREKPGHSVALKLENVDFPTVTKLYFNYDSSKGKMDATYRFSGRGDDARSMRGRGEIVLHDGNVFAIPFLGPVSGILNSIVPGMGQDVARNASASFSIADGVINTEDFLVEGTGFSMIGGGKLMFLDDRMDFSIRINARGLPGVLLFPVSKLFEYVADEKLSKPHWRSKVMPKL